MTHNPALGWRRNPSVVRQLPESTWRPVYQHLAQRRSDARAEMARCARGRLNWWTPWEPVYADGTYKPAERDDRLMAFLQRLVPEAQIAQVFYGNRGIDWHRDAAYAKPQAWVLSLGSSTFELEDRLGRTHRLRLEPGQLITFDCKCRHRAIDVDPDRIGIGLWSIKIPFPLPATS